MLRADHSFGVQLPILSQRLFDVRVAATAMYSVIGSHGVTGSHWRSTVYDRNAVSYVTPSTQSE